MTGKMMGKGEILDSSSPICNYISSWHKIDPRYFFSFQNSEDCLLVGGTFFCLVYSA